MATGRLHQVHRFRSSQVVNTLACSPFHPVVCSTSHVPKNTDSSKYKCIFSIVSYCSLLVHLRILGIVSTCRSYTAHSRTTGAINLFPFRILVILVRVRVRV